jgi:iron(III) transport system substrate-binding protein
MQPVTDSGTDLGAPVGFSRRRLLRVVGSAAGFGSVAGVLAACGGGGPPAQPTLAPAQPTPAPAAPTAAPVQPAQPTLAAAAPVGAPVAPTSPPVAALVAPTSPPVAALGAPTSPSLAASNAQAAPAMVGTATAPADWGQWVAAANQEGKIVLNTQPGETFRLAAVEFSKTYPNIAVEHTGLQLSNQFTPRIQQERAAGVYTWDVAAVPTVTALVVLKPQGTFDPLRPAIVQPECLDNAAWRDGFEAGWRDLDKQYCYSFNNDRNPWLWVNTDVVKSGDLKTAQDLLDPRWKGKIVAADPRVLGNGFWAGTAMRLKYGDDIIKQLFVDQQPSITRDPRQIVDFLVRGRYPIGIGATIEILSEFKSQGLGQNIQNLELTDVSFLGGTGTFLMNKAPHPNAARVFVNWLLSKSGQATWSTIVQTNSRRLDVEPSLPDVYPQTGRDYLQIDAEETVPKVVQTQEVAKQVMG